MISNKQKDGDIILTRIKKKKNNNEKKNKQDKEKTNTERKQ